MSGHVHCMGHCWQLSPVGFSGVARCRRSGQGGRVVEVYCVVQRARVARSPLQYCRELALRKSQCRAYAMLVPPLIRECVRHGGQRRERGNVVITGPRLAQSMHAALIQHMSMTAFSRSTRRWRQPRSQPTHHVALLHNGTASHTHQRMRV